MRGKLIPLLALLLASAAHAESGAASAPWRFAVGIGAGYEAGNGLHLGVARGAHAARLGLGLIYNDQDAEFQYSAGLRWLTTLYKGRGNDTYAWIGSAIHGHERKGDAGFMTADGAGVGAALHFGLPFRLEIDSGWDGYFDSEGKMPGIQWGPTLNGALVYEWR